MGISSTVQTCPMKQGPYENIIFLTIGVIRLNDLGAFFARFIEPLLAWIIEPGIGPALAAVILITGSFIILIALIQAIQSHVLINRAREVIGVRTQEIFAVDYNTISQDFDKIPKVCRAWREFNETLIPPSFDEQQNCIRRCENTVRPPA
jgi:hypothetical protein